MGIMGGHHRSMRLIFRVILFVLMLGLGYSDDIFLDWIVEINTSIKPLGLDQPVITINGLFPGPLINATTNDAVHVNVHNLMDEPLLMTWNGIQQRLNSWQDGVSGTNCPIQPGTNWTYIFVTKDQIGSFFYFPSINFHKAGGAYGPIRVNNRTVILIPFPKPDAEFDLLIGDWYRESFKDIRSGLKDSASAYGSPPTTMLINGKGPYRDSGNKAHEIVNVTKGKTYRLRISNVGTYWSFNFKIQNHKMEVVETEGSYTDQITVDSLDIHVGQSYSVLVTADQDDADYYIVASPKLHKANDTDDLVGVAVLHYENSTSIAHGPLPKEPNPFDTKFSIAQAQSIRWNMTAGAARPNPQGTFNVTNVTLSQTFILRGSAVEINGAPRFAVNNVSYITPSTPLKLADEYNNGSGVYQLDQYSFNSSNPLSINGTFVITGDHKGWLEIVFKNDLEIMDAWHLDGFGFYVVGFGHGDWNPKERSNYNILDPVVRSTTQVYPGGWTAVYVYLDNPGMWNLRSQALKNWYLGQELYVRVYDPDPNPAKENQPPQNLLYCGLVEPPPAPRPTPKPPPGQVPPPPPSSNASTKKLKWFHILLIFAVLAI